MMYSRKLKEDLLRSIKDDHSRVQVVYGARGVGQSTLLGEISDQVSSVFVDLSDAQHVAKLGEPLDFFKLHRGKLVILGEIQQDLGVLKMVRKFMDRRREGPPVRFLVGGVNSKSLLEQSAEILGSYGEYKELAGLSPLEIEAPDGEFLYRLRVRGGFPASYGACSDQEAHSWCKSLVATYLQEDFVVPEGLESEDLFERFCTMMAHSQASPWDGEKIGESLREDDSVAEHCLSELEERFLLRKLSPWGGHDREGGHNREGGCNGGGARIRKPVFKTPKTFLRDSGVMHTLLGIIDYEDLISRYLIYKKSWDGLVVEAILSSLPPAVKASYLRTLTGAEVELILEFGSEVWALSFTPHSVPKVYEGFHKLCLDIKATRKFAIYVGEETYPLRGDNTAISLGNFVILLREQVEAFLGGESGAKGGT